MFLVGSGTLRLYMIWLSPFHAGQVGIASMLPSRANVAHAFCVKSDSSTSSSVGCGKDAGSSYSVKKTVGRSKAWQIHLTQGSFLLPLAYHVAQLGCSSKKYTYVRLPFFSAALDATWCVGQ